MRSRKDGESSKEFRQRVLDSVSPSFCAAKWLNATIWIASGHTASCHHPPPHKIPLEGLDLNPSLLHNTVHKQAMRGQMLAGDKPKECEYCWKIESMGPDNISDRISKSDLYSQKDIDLISSAKLNQFPPLRTLEIAFDRSCNFACMYCNSGYSTKWAAEMRKFGPYQGLKSDGRGAYLQVGDWADQYKGEDGPYLDAFLNWWPELAKTLMEIKVTGGEPTVSVGFWKWLQVLGQFPLSGDLLVSFNSNLSFDSATWIKLMDKLSFVQRLGVYTSAESVGALGEYLRDGQNWAVFSANLNKVIESRRFERVVVMATISCISLPGLTDFLDWVLSIKRISQNSWIPHVSLTVLRFPSFLSISTLPDEIRHFEAQKLKDWLENFGRQGLIPPEIDGLERLIQYLTEIESPHSQTSDLMTRRQDLKLFLEQYDRRRNKDHRKVLPKAYSDWIAHIKVSRNENDKIEFVEGDASEGYHNQQDILKLAERFKIDLKLNSLSKPVGDT